MNKTWMPRATGIIDIIVGSAAMLTGAGFIIHVLSVRYSVDWTFAGLLIWMFSTPLLVFGILALVGGIYALKRKKWGWALAGSIATLLLLIIIGTLIATLDIPLYISYIVVLAGIAAIAFAILSKGEFK